MPYVHLQSKPLEGTGLSPIFFSDGFVPEVRGCLPKCHFYGGSQRRPYRWWKARACISENSAWGKRMQSHDCRIAFAVHDEKIQMLQHAMEEGRKTTTWDPVLAERNKRERKEQKAALRERSNRLN